jgi:hypothetical protein
MNEEIIKQAISEIQPKADETWKELQAINNHPEFIAWKARHDETCNKWADLHQQLKGLKSLLPQV